MTEINARTILRNVASVLAMLVIVACHAHADDPILFEESIAPIFRQNCIACHHAKKAEGGLNLENFASLSRGGDSGAIIDSTAIDKSILLERVTGRVEPIMPPSDNTVEAKPLTADQVAMLKRWIEGGAKSKASAPVSNRDYQPLPAHVQASYAIAVTPDGQWLAFTRGNDLVLHPISDWSNLSATSAQQQIQTDAHRDICFAMAASPDGQRIATGSFGEVKLWRKRVARRIPNEAVAQETPDAPSSPASQTASSPSSKSEAGGEGKPRLQFEGTNIMSIASSRDGSLIATLDQQHRLRVWSSNDVTLLEDHSTDSLRTLERQRLDRDIERQTRRIERWKAKLVELQSVAEKESKAIEAAKQAHDKAKTEWDAKNQEWQAVTKAIAELEKSLGSLQAAVEAAKQQITDLTEKQKAEKADIAKLQSAVTGTQALIELGNQKIAEITAQLDPKKKASSELQPQEEAAKAKLESARIALQQSEESHRLAVAAVDQKQSQLAPEPKLLEMMQGESERVKKETSDLAISSVAMTFTGDGKHLVMINAENHLEVFTAQPLQRIARPIPLEGTWVAIQSIGDREILLTGKEESTQRWSIAPQWELECVLGPELSGIISERVNSIAFNRDGTQLAIGSGIGSRSGHLAILGLGQLKGNNLVSSDVSILWSEPEHHSDTVLGLAYAPDGRALASSSADKMTKVIDLEKFKTIRVFEGHTHHVLGVAWHNDGFHLATTSGDGTCKVWDFESGETTRTLTVGQELTALSFVGTSNRFVSTVIDHTLRMHDIESKDQIRQFVAAQNSLYAVSVSPDGRYAIAIGQEGIPRAWQVEDGKLIAEIK
jgi:WD40 repeat protein